MNFRLIRYSESSDVAGSFSHNWPIWERVIRLLSSGQLDFVRVQSHSSLAGWHDAFEAMHSGEIVKAVASGNDSNQAIDPTVQAFITEAPLLIKETKMMFVLMTKSCSSRGRRRAWGEQLPLKPYARARQQSFSPIVTNSVAPKWSPKYCNWERRPPS